MEKNELIRRYPRVFHMAEKDTWPSIKSLGLLSATAAMDRCGITGPARVTLEEEHRPEKVTVRGAGCEIVLRDQGPMDPSRLRLALPRTVSPSLWYRMLNKLVFMWAEEERLLGLLNARRYRHLEHDVLTIDLASFVGAYEKSMWLCPMNSGNTFPIPHRRNLDTFRRIKDYPVKRSGGPEKPVVEVVTDYSVPDISKFVVGVRRMRGAEVISELPL
jgi:hypothetical protein